jgi:hypothetical protein
MLDATIAIINQHRQQYQHQYFREKQPKNPGQHRRRSNSTNTIVEDVIARKKYCKNNPPCGNYEKKKSKSIK